jgi:hypothetical protein
VFIGEKGEKRGELLVCGICIFVLQTYVMPLALVHEKNDYTVKVSAATP